MKLDKDKLSTMHINNGNLNNRQLQGLWSLRPIDHCIFGNFSQLLKVNREV